MELKSFQNNRWLSLIKLQLRINTDGAVSEEEKKIFNLIFYPAKAPRGQEKQKNNDNAWTTEDTEKHRENFFNLFFSSFYNINFFVGQVV